MTLINVIKFVLSSFFLFFFIQVSSQNIKKETLYILFQKNDGEQPEFRGKKFINSHGINFNLLKKRAFIHKKGMKRDTLCINELKKYNLTDENNINKKANLWRERNKEKLKKKYGLLYRQAFEYKNNIFDTYIIEKINSKKIVLYEVKFRNEGAIP